MNSLIIGGSSGLGLEIAHRMASSGDHVTITGRTNPNVDFATFNEFSLTDPDLPTRIGKFVTNLPDIHTLVYAAGYYQEGHIDNLTDEQVDDMVNVGGRGLLFFTKKLLEKQGKLGELVTITSTSQWTPRELEPVYNFVKAGAGHLSHGLSKDPRIGKTVVAGPSGMDTAFWKDQNRDTSAMMDPAWVASKVMVLRTTDNKYTFARILGAHGDLPNRVEITEEEA